MNANVPLLRLLADGRFHSGEALAGHLGVSRAAVWKRLKQAGTLPGIEVQAIRGRGYRLSTPLSLLDEVGLRSHISAGVADRIDLEIAEQLPSTNAHLMAQPAPQIGRARVCLAEHQTAGRGRRGRPWISGFGRNLTLSLAWSFEQPMSALAGLSLAAGVAVAEALSDAGASGHGLKWPNDLYLAERKLAGILVEASGEASGPTRVVIGIGLNLMMDTQEALAIDQPWADLQEQLGSPPPRNRIAALLIEHLSLACDRYASEGLAPFLATWQQHDIHLGRDVCLTLGDRRLLGRYVGLADDGALLLETPEGRQAFQGGEVSLRPAGMA